MNPIVLQSRYGDTRTIECVDPKQGIFVMYGKSIFTRGGEGMFDFEGGPILQVGEQFYGLGTIAGLDSNRKGEKYETEACVYISVDMNTRTIDDFNEIEDRNRKSRWVA